MIDYNAPAELFMPKRNGGARQPLGYRRFATAAQAICFVVEKFPAMRTLGAWMRVGASAAMKSIACARVTTIRCRAAHQIKMSVADTNLTRKRMLLSGVDGVVGAARTPPYRAIDTSANQCVLSSITTTSVGSGSWGTRLVI